MTFICGIFKKGYVFISLFYVPKKNRQHILATSRFDPKKWHEQIEHEQVDIEWCKPKWLCGPICHYELIESAA